MLPTKKQWKKWTLPSKYALISIIIGIIGLIPIIIDTFDKPDYSKKIINRSTEKLLFLFFDNYNEELIDNFVENIMIKDRIGMILLLKKMFKYSEINVDKKIWIDFLNSNEESIYHKTNVSNQMVADLIKILATARIKINKEHNNMIFLVNKTVMNSFFKIKQRKYKSYRLDYLENDLIESLLKNSSLENSAFKFLFKKTYYICHDKVIMIHNEQFSQSFRIYGISNYGKFYAIEDGWDYEKVASDVCSKYIRRTRQNEVKISNKSLEEK
jgi:hypothetical protein